MKRCFRKWLICTKEIINIITQDYFTPYKMKKHHYMYTYTCLFKKRNDAGTRQLCRFTITNSHASDLQILMRPAALKDAHPTTKAVPARRFLELGLVPANLWTKQPFHPLLYHLKREIPVRCCLIPYFWLTPFFG